MKEIQLQNNRGVTLVDDEDYEYLSQFKWVYHQSGRSKTAYAYGRTTGPSDPPTPMHRVLLPGAKRVDHIDRNGLNNQKDNLRACTQSQNCANSVTKVVNPTGYRGVFPVTNHYKWRAAISYEGKHIHIGSFDTPEEAARARDEVAKDLFGEFAILNFS